ncbi:hypothetical protein PC9H_007210 [Pleurotus ostreatus]|uniref:Uncharacterized protein n=1 Tax=Pleurotus ostreatus TaxID=5322 RepID=A0A8H6ZXQ6_PLEOS|nr:uncharacterized protein PC9H_007210 [Pleurotus ostreatus]KAF7427992.1 hypothetical protein PC9H_007210 [Pleurotus ostreatus]KAJ8696029.1 hypothetical protein PTI98_005931 [Pleurotus ostreatus]
MHAFAHILACALPFLILKFHITTAASSGTSEPGSLTQGNAVAPGALSTTNYETDTTMLQAREIRNADYSSSSPQDTSPRNTTATPARDVTEKDSPGHTSTIDNDEHAHRGAHSTDGARNVLFSRAAGKFQVKQLRQRSVDLGSGAVTKSISGPDSKADPPSKRGTPVVFIPRPIATADRPQGGNRVMSGFNPPDRPFEDFGWVNHRSFEDSAANKTTSDHRSSPLEFQVSDHIRHVEE